MINNYILALGGSGRQQYFKVRLDDGLVERRVDVEPYSRLGFTQKPYNTIPGKYSSLWGTFKVIDFDTRESTLLTHFSSVVIGQDPNFLLVSPYIQK